MTDLRETYNQMLADMKNYDLFKIVIDPNLSAAHSSFPEYFTLDINGMVTFYMSPALSIIYHNDGTDSLTDWPDFIDGSSHSY